ncbi:MAG: SDR family oxidoreductase [Simkaniaceae bacterium]
MEWKNKRCLVVGGSSGMGLEIAKAIRERSGQVFIAARNTEKLQKAKHALNGGEAYSFDMTKEEQVRRLFSEIKSLDHLIISAAGHFFGSFQDSDVSAARAFFDNKFWGQYMTAKYGSKVITPGGSIIFFSGVANIKPLNGFSCGAAINGAIEGLTRSLAMELAPIRVNAISPGVVDTPAWSGFEPAEKKKHFEAVAKKLPVHKVGKPEDIAPAAIYLMESTYTTGLTVYVDGGERII